MNTPLVVAIVVSLSVFAFLFTAAYHWLMFGVRSGTSVTKPSGDMGYKLGYKLAL